MLLSSCLCPTQRHVSRKARSLLLSVHYLKAKPTATNATTPPPSATTLRRQLSYKYSDPNKYPSPHWTTPCTPLLHREFSTCRATASIATRSAAPVVEEEEDLANDDMLQKIDSPVDILALIESAGAAKQKQQQQQQQQQQEQQQKSINDQRRTNTRRRNVKDEPHCSVADLETFVNTQQFAKALEALCRTSRVSYYPSSIRHELYQQIAQLEPPDIVQLIRPWAVQHTNENIRAWRIIKDTSEFWSREKLVEMVRYCSGSEHDERLQIHLFSRLLAYYRRTKDINSLLQVIPRDDEGSVTIKLFNMALNASLRQNWLKDAEVVLREMQERNVEFDAASFNILIRSKLKQGKRAMEGANAIYNEMQDCNIEPTMATFNTFIDYSCQFRMWDDLQMWIDRMQSKDMDGDSITLRLLVEAMLLHPHEPKLVTVLEHVATAVPISPDEQTLNPIITTFLRHKRTKAALTLLDKIFSLQHEIPPSSYAYNLLIHGLSQQGDLEAAHQVIDAMYSGNDHRIPPPDIVSYTTLIHGYIRKAESDDIDIDTILRLYHQLRSSGLQSNGTLQTVLLHGIIKSRYVDIEKTRRLFDMMIAEDDRRCFLPDPSEEEPLDQTILYNMMMDGYFIHAYHRNQQRGLAVSSVKAQRELLDEAIRKKLELTTASLNIWIRGVAVFNKDLAAARSLVKQFERLGIEANERTMWYLCWTAYTMGKPDKVRRWLREYEGQGHVVLGRGFCELKSRLRI
ncbi:hypothetical protein BDB00DRAFT_833208 [Zychaea mexicana]|uniref:uncharacterized protein n=1 Tax=Zychaea mexicana TaxID=64656 RepID=UPI0022FF2324|nr:uncharacterized protein BDB00DRAFT_833208 [Zychaea mexicana]KAI9491342.1 hypothetical protein BDB00DRAFT_833208 [Zychaea mexicana]